MDNVKNNAQSATIDPQQFQQFQSADGSAFSSAIAHPDSSAQGHLPPMYASDLTHPDPMAVPMHMQSVTVSPLDLIRSSLPEHISPTSMLSDFSRQSGPSYMQDPPMRGIESLDVGVHNHNHLSSPTATSASANHSHMSSPSLNGMVSTAFVMGSSSLASALDGSRSRSGSSASPSHLPGSSSDIGFPSSNSGPPSSAQDPTFPFSTVFDSSFSVHQSKENSPDMADPHLMVLGDMLKSIAKTANSGSEAFSSGHTTSAANLVDQLAKNVMLVAKMVQSMNLNDPANHSPSAAGSPHARTSTASSVSNGSPPSSVKLDAAQAQHINGLSAYDSSNTSLDPSLLDASDMSRKRCASNTDGDRAVKAMKIEPPDEIPLQIPSMHPPLPPPPHLTASSSFNFNPSSSAVIPMADQITSVPSLPVTRPPSSSGHGMKLMSDIQTSHQPMHFPPRMDFAPQLSHSTDFAALPSGPATAPTLATSAFPSNANLSNPPWPDSRPGTRHAHSLSGTGSSMSMMQHAGIPSAIMTNLVYTPTSASFHSPTHANMPPMPSAMPSSATIGRMSRSSSFSHSNPFAFGVDPVPVAKYEPMQSRPSTSGGPRNGVPSPQEGEEDEDNDDSDDGRQAYSTSPSASARRGSRASPSADSAGHNNEVPQEYRADVERIFFEFLNKTCSNLDATDAKGEPIHQTLMAKKMQRLDESPDFRPFKFRIQAFTNAFLEELSRQGFPEEKIPMKKIRNFLWNQPYISRFNEEGKKSKSKGNHIWHVDAKKTEPGWAFRPFQRKLAGAPPGVAYIGLRWSWTPRIWDPQASRANMPVTYTSPNLPPWLFWNDDTLSGIPPPDAESCDVTVEARFVQEGKEEMLSHTVHVNIAPMTAVDASFTPSRRPSLVGDLHNPRRVMSDSVLPQTNPPRILRTQPALAPAPPVVAPDSQVVQVLTTAAQRVAQEAQSQVVASNDMGPELHSLAKQQHVLTITAQAFNNKATGEPPIGSASQSDALAAAAQQVVLQAARQVAADRTVAAVSSGISPSQAVTTQVTVKEVSVATQSAVAQAVEMVGPLSSEVDVMMTAKSLLQQQTRSPLTQAAFADAAGLPPNMDPARPHSTAVPFPSASMLSGPPPIPSFYAHAV